MPRAGGLIEGSVQRALFQLTLLVTVIGPAVLNSMPLPSK
jgi:hypothetical protein